jgi:alpha,alpha-trehalose phosphorylase
VLSFRPQLPSTITRLGFAIRWRGATVQVDVTPDSVTYTRREGPDVEIRHCSDTFTLSAEPVHRPTCRVEPITPTPTQPAGRVPIHLRPEA